MPGGGGDRPRSWDRSESTVVARFFAGHNELAPGTGEGAHGSRPGRLARLPLPDNRVKTDAPGIAEIPTTRDDSTILMNRQG